MKDAKKKLAQRKATASKKDYNYNPDVAIAPLPGYPRGVYAVSPYGAMPMSARDYETQQSRFGKARRLKGSRGYDV